MSDKMSIWNAVCETDKQHTKSFSRMGGFKGTAINQTYQVMRATELWGPIGDKWGFEISKEEWVNGAPLIDKEQVVGNEIVHVATVRLWYPGPSGERAYVEHKGQTSFVGRNKYGFYTDEEASKKSVTDAVSKCLAMLGFSADIYLGLWDDNKYMNSKAEAERKITLPEEKKAPTPSPVLTVDQRLDNAKAALNNSKSKDDLDRARARYRQSYQQKTFSEQDVKVLDALYEQMSKKF